MADRLDNYQTNRTPTKDIGQTIADMVTVAGSNRKGYERKWYDNNFFDDGHHYRYLSRGQNRIVDLSERATLYAPMRAIPKASRQIRGVTNLLVSSDPTPIVYPEKIGPSLQRFVQVQGEDGQPQTIENPAYTKALDQAKDMAKKSGHWLEKVFDENDFTQLIAHVVLLAQKNYVGWLKVYPDPLREKIRMLTRDAFEVYVLSDVNDPEDSPFMIETTPWLINEIKANENFDPEQVIKISPDNKYANSEIKQAYMSSKFNKLQSSDQSATLLMKEAYIKEYLGDGNMDRIKAQKDGAQILKDKKEGDMVMRQVFVAGNIWLRDRYVRLPHYPLVDFRMEPGPMYGVAQIERFIPANKSLDMLVSRAERYSHTMVTGSWSQKSGEQYKIDNTAGGQVHQYTTTPPIQNQIAPIPQFYFELMGLMGQLIEEQGVTTSTLGKLPSGVKANAAIESLKESEYANLVIASRRLKQTIKRIAERCFDIADDHFVKPQTVYYMDKGNPEYFDVIGDTAFRGRKKAQIDTPDNAVRLKRDYHVDIEIENGMAYTKEGQKAAMKDVIQELLAYAEAGYVAPDAIKVVIEKYLETYQFGATSEFMEAMEEADVTGAMTKNQLMTIKTAVLEALKDAGEVGQEASDKRIMENKLGSLEALRDSGLIDGKSEDPKKMAEVAKIIQDMENEEKINEGKIAQIKQDMALKEREAEVDAALKRAQAEANARNQAKLTEAKATQLKKTPVVQKGGSNATR